MFVTILCLIFFISVLKTEYRGCYVDIGPVVGTDDKIWTISVNEHCPGTPLVMLHGMGSGSALWVLNLDTIAQNRPVYCIDLLGKYKCTFHFRFVRTKKNEEALGNWHLMHVVHLWVFLTFSYLSLLLRQKLHLHIEMSGQKGQYSFIDSGQMIHC
jgi:hypothetical protein